VGNRGSKSVFNNTVKEQRVNGSWCDKKRVSLEKINHKESNVNLLMKNLPKFNP